MLKKYQPIVFTMPVQHVTPDNGLSKITDRLYNITRRRLHGKLRL